jgi:hypothetical protein
METPTLFREDVFKEAQKILHDNRSKFKPSAELVLAQVAGGPALVGAMSILEFPPCTDEGECSKCWVQKWCVHVDTPLATRIALVDTLRVFTAPGLKIHNKAAEKIKTLDKTNLASINKILAIAEYYANQPIPEIKVKENDKPKDT